MKTEKIKLQCLCENLKNSLFIQKLSRHYPTEIFPTENELIMRIHLRDHNRKLVDVFNIPVNSEGFVHAETVIEFIVLAFEMGLET
jgi:hypothetical protein